MQLTRRSASFMASSSPVHPSPTPPLPLYPSCFNHPASILGPVPKKLHVSWASVLTSTLGSPSSPLPHFSPKHHHPSFKTSTSHHHNYSPLRLYHQIKSPTFTNPTIQVERGWQTVTYKRPKKSQSPQSTKKPHPWSSPANYHLPLKYRRCYRCGERGHLAMSCRNAVVCSLCHGLGHYSYSCPRKLTTTSQPPSTKNHISIARHYRQVTPPSPTSYHHFGSLAPSSHTNYRRVQTPPPPHAASSRRSRSRLRSSPYPHGIKPNTLYTQD